MANNQISKRKKTKKREKKKKKRKIKKKKPKYVLTEICAFLYSSGATYLECKNK